MVSEVINEVSLEWDVSKRMVPFWEILAEYISINFKELYNFGASLNRNAQNLLFNFSTLIFCSFFFW